MVNGWMMVVNPPVGFLPFNGDPLDALQCRCNDGGGGGVGGGGSSIWVIRSRVKSPRSTLFVRQRVFYTPTFRRGQFTVQRDFISRKIQYKCNDTHESTRARLRLFYFPPPRARLNLCFLWSPPYRSRWCRCTASPVPVTSARRHNSVPIVSTCTIVIRLYARYIAPYRRIMSRVFLNRSERVSVAVTYFSPLLSNAAGVTGRRD